MVTDQPASRQQASDWICWAITQAGGESHRFSGISAYKGSISVAIDAGVDEAILYLQSGHGQALPARAYMQICVPGSLPRAKPAACRVAAGCFARTGLAARYPKLSPHRRPHVDPPCRRRVRRVRRLDLHDRCRYRRDQRRDRRDRCRELRDWGRLPSCAAAGAAPAVTAVTAVTGVTAARHVSRPPVSLRQIRPRSRASIGTRLSLALRRGRGGVAVEATRFTRTD